MLESSTFADLVSRARRVLSRDANVLGVGFGFKETAGAVSAVPAFRIYVRRKIALGGLGHGERLPSSIFGVPTDVLPAMRGCPMSSAAPAPPASRLPIGTPISNLKAARAQPTAGAADAGVGTLSFIAANNGEAAQRTLVVVSNQHVLLAHDARPGDPIYQVAGDANPARDRTESYGPRVIQGADLAPLATISHEGVEGNCPYAYPGEQPGIYFLDCAAARLAPERVGDVWPRFVDAGVERTIRGIARLHPLDALAGRELRVSAITAFSGVVRGRVVDVAAPVLIGDGPPRHNNIVVRADGAATGTAFIREGDSGALVVDERGRAVGMLWGRSRSDPGQAFACHIHPVLNRLNVTLITYAVSGLRRGAFAAAHGTRRRGARR
jgi:hypothetical protein